jgi:hypothetical protein
MLDLIPKALAIDLGRRTGEQGPFTPPTFRPITEAGDRNPIDTPTVRADQM